MEYKEIKKLIDDMGNSKLTEMEIEFPDGIKISMKKDDGKKAELPAFYQPQVMPQIIPPISQLPQVTTNTQTQVNLNNNQNTDKKEEVQDGKVVKSPMVGTFYSKPSPTAEPFVKIGSKVKKGDKLCIIEAMKLMNEIDSEFDGEIVEILVQDEKMVEYGEPLFIIK